MYKNPYDYTIFDNDPKNPDNTRIRTGIFPYEAMYIYLLKTTILFGFTALCVFFFFAAVT